MCTCSHTTTISIYYQQGSPYSFLKKEMLRICCKSLQIWKALFKIHAASVGTLMYSVGIFLPVNNYLATDVNVQFDFMKNLNRIMLMEALPMQ